MSDARSTPRRVLISYSHDSQGHREAVLALAQRLRAHGIDAWLDQFEPSPPQGWPRWIVDQVRRANYVVLICSSTYKRRFEGREQQGVGRGVSYEGLLASQLLYEGKLDHHTLVPVLLPGGTKDDIPIEVRAGTHHTIPDEFDDLVARLTDRLAVVPVALDPAPAPATGMPDEPSAGDQLGSLYEELEPRELAGEDVGELRSMIAVAHGRLREGPSLQSGDFLADRYRLIDIAGQGNFGVVWQAWDRQEHQRVAVKVLHRQWSEDPVRVQRFFRGASQMAALKHAGIVPILRESVDDENHHFFVMAWMPGGDLVRAVQENRIPRSELLRTLARVAEALDHAHAAGIIHRDVKPHNIMLDAEGNAALVDFDLVQTADTVQAAGATPMESFVYAAPELLENVSRVDRKVDVYGLGMTALYCLLGRDPPAVVIRTEPRILETLPCSEALARAIAAAVAYDRDERAKDGSDLIRALRAPEQPAVLLGPPIVGDVPRPAKRVPAWVWATLGATGFAALVTGLGMRDWSADGEAETEGLELAQAPAIEPEPPIEPDTREPEIAVPPAQRGPGVLVPTFAVDGDRRCDPTRFRPVPIEPLGGLTDAATGNRCGIVRTTLANTDAPLDLVGLTGGQFTMGSPIDEKGHEGDEEQHRVFLQPFSMGRTEVSQAQYEVVTGQKPNCLGASCADDLPVHHVSWYDALRFMNAMTRWDNQNRAQNDDAPDLTECYDENTWDWQRDCTGYRLPTEAEWEYAARAGTTTAWSFGSDILDVCEYANVNDHANMKRKGTCEDGFERHAPVETTRLKPNAWGLHGMHGNVWEWVFDVHAAYGATPAQDDAARREKRVLRGGSFGLRPMNVRSASRWKDQPADRSEYNGFRCARGPGPSSP